MTVNANRNGNSDIQFYLDVLKSNECHCGRYKKPKHALCFRCYHKLPVGLQKGLYLLVCGGFEQADEDAAAFLIDR